MASHDRDGYTKRSQLANALLELSESAQQLPLKEQLLMMEQRLLEGPAGPDKHQALERLENMLSATRSVLSSSSLEGSLAQLNSLDEGIRAWQQATLVQGGPRMSIRNLFSKKARDDKKRQQMIEAMEAQMGKLDTMSATLNATISQDEQQMDQLKQAAAKLQPSTAEYRRLRNQFTVIEKRQDINNLTFQQISRSLEVIGSQLSVLRSERDMTMLSTLMPANMDKVNADMALRIQNIEQMVDTAKFNAESALDMMQDMESLIDKESGDSSFDQNVAEIRKHNETLEMFDEPVKAEEPVAKEELQAPQTSNEEAEKP